MIDKPTGFAPSVEDWGLRPRSVFSVLEDHAARDGDEAIIVEGRKVTYAELAERVDACARSLLDQGLMPDRVTAISIPDDIEHLTAALALICLGAPQINLGSHEADAVKQSLLAKLGVTQIVAARPASWMGDATVYSPAPRSQPATDRSPLLRRISLDTILLYCPTSGSTNVPKTFGLTLERLLRIARRHAETPSERRVLRTSSIEFHSTRLHRLCALLAGHTCVISHDIDLKSIVEICASADVSEIQIGTYKLVSLLRGETNGRKLPTFTRIVTGGSRVPGAVRREIKERLSDNLWVSYATSEIGPISLATPEEHDEFPEGVGQPMPGVTVMLVDDNDNEVALGEVGQAKINKPAMPMSYFADEAASAAFRDGWFYPRDLLSRAGDGPLIFHGRVDDMMILNGINIFPSAIEDLLEIHPDVSEAVAYAVPSRIHGEIPVAAVVLRDATGPRDTSYLLDHCRQTLGLRAPRQIVIVDSIPRNTAGKPLRRELAKS